ncbi:hypothetical protein AB0L40_17865 [Patulibacter sp. NPDC049589]|uniref:hypothetical protein n=1 Tax=Patulibacter sp. NPDC049589 TaxID=3154731 RepID=UPI003434611C
MTKLCADGKALRAATVNAADARKIGRDLRARYADDGAGDGCDSGQVVSLVVPASRSTPAVDVRWHRTLDVADSVEGC